jgi:hypothetical protein
MTDEIAAVFKTGGRAGRRAGRPYSKLQGQLISAPLRTTKMLTGDAEANIWNFLSWRSSMRDAFTMRFRPEVAEFVQAQASAGNRSVTNFVETLLLREKARFEESQRQLTVQAVADLLRHEQHNLVRDADETEAEYTARRELFGALLDHARHG